MRSSFFELRKQADSSPGIKKILELLANQERLLLLANHGRR
jgi:hypothetical protein